MFCISEAYIDKNEYMKYSVVLRMLTLLVQDIHVGLRYLG